MQQTQGTSVLTGTRALHYHSLYRVTSYGEENFGGPLPQTLAMSWRKRSTTKEKLQCF